MPGRGTVLSAVAISTIVSWAAVASCASRPPALAVSAAHPAGTTSAITSATTAADAQVTVTPATGLRNRQRVTVRVAGFPAGSKVFLSECAAARDVNPLGCGPQLAAQPFLVTGDNGTAKGVFRVSGRASAKPYSPPKTHTCADRCVIVATLGGVPRPRYVYARISFTRDRGGAATRQAAAAARGVPVVINCLKRGQIRPRQFVFTCADALSVMTGLRWSSWAPAAFASGRWWFDDCVPTCVQGHSHMFPALFVLWRPEPWPGHPGTRYFTRATTILTGKHSYRAAGRVYRLPVTSTGTLSASGGL